MTAKSELTVIKIGGHINLFGQKNTVFKFAEVKPQERHECIWSKSWNVFYEFRLHFHVLITVYSGAYWFQLSIDLSTKLCQYVTWHDFKILSESKCTDNSVNCITISLQSVAS